MSTAYRSAFLTMLSAAGLGPRRPDLVFLAAGRSLSCAVRLLYALPGPPWYPDICVGLPSKPVGASPIGASPNSPAFPAYIK